MEHYAFRRGPIVLAQDNRLGIDVSGSVDYDVTNDYVDAAVTDDAPYKNMVAVTVPLRDGSRMTLTDYASAGKDGQSIIAAWLPSVIR